MAEALAGAGAGHNLGRATFLEFCTEHSKVERELADVAETRRSLNRRRKDLRKNMAAAGIDIDMFDLHLADLELTQDEREVRAAAYARYMAWRNAPVGFQASMDIATTADPGDRAFNSHELHTIDGEGFDAGKGGTRRDANPYQPGTEGYQRWDNAWYRGQAVAVERLGSGTANGTDSAAPRRRGRPRKDAARTATPPVRVRAPRNRAKAAPANEVEVPPAGDDEPAAAAQAQ